MLFLVSSKKTKVPNYYPHVVLVHDNWDDYGYRTTFHSLLYLAADDRIDLGTVKIMRNDQQNGATLMPPEPFERLGPEYASLGSDLTYYEKLYKLGRPIFHRYLRGLRDFVYDDAARAEVEDLEGFRVSLLRFSGSERTIADATRLLNADAPPTKRRRSGFKVRFKTRVATAANSFTIEFDFRRQGSLPNRINALIGYNGTGKTRLLSNLAIVASGYGYSSKEDLLDQAAGRFVGARPPFKSVIVVSYSAFDTFVIPGGTAAERKRLEQRGELFGYVYCGLRELENVHRGEEASYRLRTPSEVEREFLAALRRVRRRDRLEALLEILKPLLRDASFQRIGLTELYAKSDDEEVGGLFRELSSGHKVVLKIVTELTAHIAETEPTLVLIDEPETHLHPPLLAAFLKSVRACLDRFDGYAVIATHSPVVLQETPGKYVHVLRRAANQSRAVPVSIETFAESIGVITQEVFNLGDGTTDWHDTLRLLARRYSIEEIEQIFGRPMGFAARSYLLSVQDEDDQ